MNQIPVHYQDKGAVQVAVQVEVQVQVAVQVEVQVQVAVQAKVQGVEAKDQDVVQDADAMDDDDGVVAMV
jgi:hypothetical protein